MIRTVTQEDAQAITDIYNYYIEHTVVTFEEQKVTVDDMAQRIYQVLSSDHIWLVAEINHRVVGYAYSTKWRERSAYRFACEVTVYLSHDYKGKGLGTRLYQALFSKLETLSMKTAIAGITMPNEASVALHEKFGMKQAATFESVGYKFDQWLNVGYWQKQLS